jgi:hypothetical protein
MDNFNFDKNQMKSLEKFSDMSTSFMFKMVGWITKGMIFLSKNAKLIFGIILLIIFFKVGTYVVSIEPKGVYEITTSSGTVYNTNAIEVKDGCVYFKKMNTQEETIICGDCIIVKN